MRLFTLNKQERLSGLSEINGLFREGNAFNSGPLRFVYRMVQSDVAQIKMLASVPRRKFKKAVIRNRIKRLIREAYRHHKPGTDSVQGTLHVGFIYIGESENITQHEIDKAMVYGLKRLLNEINN